jgi:elongation factor 1-beta
MPKSSKQSKASKQVPKSTEPVQVEEPPKKKEIKELLGIFDILPEDEETDLNLLLEKTKEILKPFNARLDSYRIEEIAYGLKKIVAKIIFPEKEGGTQPLEDALTNMGNVQRAECQIVSNLGTTVKM